VRGRHRDGDHPPHTGTNCAVSSVQALGV
jgi:hypothetical protein